MTNTLQTTADQLVAQGRDLLEQGNLPEATRLLNQANNLYWQAGDYYQAAAQTGNYGWALRRKGRLDLARPYLESAAEMFTQIGMQEFAERHRHAAEDVNPDVTQEFLAGLPPAVRGALERGDGAALQFALDALPVAEQQIVTDSLIEAGIVSPPASEDLDDVVSQFEPLLQGIAAVAHGDSSDKADIELALDDLERKGWRIKRAVEKIWQGKRSISALAYNLDETDTRLVERVLELVNSK